MEQETIATIVTEEMLKAAEELVPQDLDENALVIELPPEPECLAISTQEQVIIEDVKYFNYVLSRLRQKWEQAPVLDVEDTCKLAAATMKALEARRKMMLLPTEADKKTSGPKGMFLGAFSD